VKAGVIGATGYAGAELVRLLAGHPKIDELILSSVSFEGERIADIYPNFAGRITAPLLNADAVIAAADVVFAALPHGVGEQFAKSCFDKGVPFIDLSADFRFGDDEATFSAWYGKPYQYPELHLTSVYGLPELNRERIKECAASGAATGKAIIGNPGCYPTGASLGIFPAFSKGLIAEGATIIVDSVSGTSGGGRELARSFHYAECADSVAPYKIGSHRHTPEIERTVAAMAEAAAARSATKPAAVPSIIFTPHLAPMNRGILSTIYIPLAADKVANITKKAAAGTSAEKIAAILFALQSLYADFYRDEPFVRVLPEGVIAATNRVRQSNYCDISVHTDHKGTTLIIATAIDNMVKGAAGQAIQNMNILFGFDERSGLGMIPALF